MSAQPERDGPVRRPATYEDLVALPEHVVGEILDGALYVQPRPAPRHALASSLLGGALSEGFSGGYSRHGGWRILDEPELRLGEDTVVPDIAGWRLPRLAELPSTPYIDLPPDWICEVLSPSTASRDRIVKQAIYAREDVGHMWFVDPTLRTVEVYALIDARWSLVAAVQDDATVALPPFEALEFPLARLWA